MVRCKSGNQTIICCSLKSEASQLPWREVFCGSVYKQMAAFTEVSPVAQDHDDVCNNIAEQGGKVPFKIIAHHTVCDQALEYQNEEYRQNRLDTQQKKIALGSVAVMAAEAEPGIQGEAAQSQQDDTVNQGGSLEAGYKIIQPGRFRAVISSHKALEGIQELRSAVGKQLEPDDEMKPLHGQLRFRLRAGNGCAYILGQGSGLLGCATGGTEPDIVVTKTAAVGTVMRHGKIPPSFFDSLYQ